MQNKWLCLMISAIVIISYTGCASSSGGSGSRSAMYTSTIGTAWQNHIEMRVPRILGQYGYTLNEERVGPEFSRFSTSWEIRDLYPDEIQAGVATARIRVTIESRSRGRTHSAAGGTPERASVSITIENSFQMNEGEDWVPHEIGEGLQGFIREFESEIRRQLEIRN